jgi:hypothetical protein
MLHATGSHRRCCPESAQKELGPEGDGVKGPEEGSPVLKAMPPTPVEGHDLSAGKSHDDDDAQDDGGGNDDDDDEEEEEDDKRFAM